MGRGSGGRRVTARGFCRSRVGFGVLFSERLSGCRCICLRLCVAGVQPCSKYYTYRLLWRSCWISATYRQGHLPTTSFCHHCQIMELWYQKDHFSHTLRIQSDKPEYQYSLVAMFPKLPLPFHQFSCQHFHHLYATQARKLLFSDFLYQVPH